MPLVIAEVIPRHEDRRRRHRRRTRRQRQHPKPPGNPAPADKSDESSGACGNRTNTGGRGCPMIAVTGTTVTVSSRAAPMTERAHRPGVARDVPAASSHLASQACRRSWCRGHQSAAQVRRGRPRWASRRHRRRAGEAQRRHLTVTMPPAGTTDSGWVHHPAHRRPRRS
jgi:hypothetical protein